MKHSTGKPTKAQQKRFEKLWSLGCVACKRDLEMLGVDFGMRCCGVVQIHHLNLDGKAGQKRRGHDFTVPLGAWHHQAVPKVGYKSRDMQSMYGPSLKLQSRAFRDRYGADDELLEYTNKLIGVA